MTRSPTLAEPVAASRAPLVLWAEFVGLYVGLPLAMAFLLPPSAMWPAMGAAAAFALVMLTLQPGFRWRGAFGLPTRAQAARIALFGAGIFALCVALALWLLPGALFSLPRYRPGLWLMIMLLYPIFSALPQEIIFRTLFYTRYRGLFPNGAVAAAVNGAVFGLAHLFFWNWVAVAMTAAGGVIFALAHQAAGPRRGLMVATLLHALAGMALFTAGLGMFFYHGAVGR